LCCGPSLGFRTTGFGVRVRYGADVRDGDFREGRCPGGKRPTCDGDTRLDWLQLRGCRLARSVSLASGNVRAVTSVSTRVRHLVSLFSYTRACTFSANQTRSTAAIKRSITVTHDALFTAHELDSNELQFAIPVEKENVR